MNIPIHHDFTSAINEVKLHLRQSGNHLETESWQGMKKPPEFYEALNVSFAAMIPSTSIETLKIQVKPNLPWADDHFRERVGGKPLNPGNEYKNWPPYKNNPSNDKFRTTGEGQFSHTYMERFWPKHAGNYQTGCGGENYTNRGIRFDYGDLSTLLGVLKAEPFTRQAFIPIWFPEDGEAALAGSRVPCTLGYHFIRRGDSMHINYYIRSCDFIRHFRDDIYLACRLLYYIIQVLKSNDYTKWATVQPGIFTMHITSLHIFSKEYNLLKD